MLVTQIKCKNEVYKHFLISHLSLALTNFDLKGPSSVSAGKRAHQCREGGLDYYSGKNTSFACLSFFPTVVTLLLQP